MDKNKGLVERLKSGEVTVAAEGFLLELERRGYNSNGSFVPTVVLDNPEQVEQLTREYVHAGSDICMAFTYYAHKEKLRILGRGDEFTTLNRRAHDIAKKVARETGTLFCAGFGTTNVFDPKSEDSIRQTEQLFREQIALSAECGVDFVALETLWDYGEASIALKICNEFNLPTIITLCPVDTSEGPCMTFDGLPMVEALQRLENEGAVCVGLNCARGPETLIPIVRDIRPHIKGPMACVSLGYRTTKEQPNWYKLRHPGTGEKSFPDNLSAHYLGKIDVEWYADQLKQIGVEYVGFCCGNSAVYTRTLAMAFGKHPPAEKYESNFKEKSIFTKGDGADVTRNRYNHELAIFNGLMD